MMAIWSAFDLYDVPQFLYYLSGLNPSDFDNRIFAKLYTTYRMTVIVGFIALTVTVLMDIGSSEPTALPRIFGVLLLMVGIAIKSSIMYPMQVGLMVLHRKLQKKLNNPWLERNQWAKDIAEKVKGQYTNIFLFMYGVGGVTTLSFIMPTWFVRERELPLPFPSLQLVSDEQFHLLRIWHTAMFLLIYISYISYDVVSCGYFIRMTALMEIVTQNVENFRSTISVVDYKRHVPDYEEYDECDSTAQPYDNRVYGCLMILDDSPPKKQTAASHSEKIIIFLKENIFHCADIVQQMYKLRRQYRVVIVVQFFGGTTVTVLFGLVAFVQDWTHSHSIQQLLFVLSCLADVFAYCYCGQKLKEASEKFNWTLYQYPWYEMDIPTRKFFSYCLPFTHITLKLKMASNEVNYSLYLSINTLGYNYLALLKNLI